MRAGIPRYIKDIRKFRSPKTPRKEIQNAAINNTGLVQGHGANFKKLALISRRIFFLVSLSQQLCVKPPSTSNLKRFCGKNSIWKLNMFFTSTLRRIGVKIKNLTRRFSRKFVHVENYTVVEIPLENLLYLHFLAKKIPSPSRISLISSLVNDTYVII